VRLADVVVVGTPSCAAEGIPTVTYEAIREVDIAAEKHEAIAACRDADHLVPTVVTGVNEDETGRPRGHDRRVRLDGDARRHPRGSRTRGRGYRLL